MLALCGSIGEEDGLDRREAGKLLGTRSRKKKADDHRQLRLCKQISNAISLLLADSPLALEKDIRVTEVIPGRQVSNVVVRITSDEELDVESRKVAEAELREMEGWLRSEVAIVITRKRVPRLRFEFVSVDANSNDDATARQKESHDEQN